MNTERWRWRSSSSLKTLPLQSPSPSPSPSYPHDGLFVEPQDPVEGKKPRVLTKALRTMSSSSLDSMSAPTRRKSGSIRRLQKPGSGSGSGSMIERLQRRVSRDSTCGPLTPERPASPMDQLQSFSLMEVLRAGPLKVDVSLLKARTEYLVLSDQCLIKFGSLEAARSVFPMLNQNETNRRASTISQAPNSKSTYADVRFEAPLRSVVAVFADDTSNNRSGLEIWWFSKSPKLAYCNAHLFFALPEERDVWLSAIQRACKAKLRQNQFSSTAPENLKARIDNMVRSSEPMIDGYSPNLIFPIAKRGIGATQKPTASEESQGHMDVSSYYLVVGPCMCYFVEVLKADYSTPANDLRLKVVSFGTVTLTRVRASVASHEQRFIMSFRLPFGRETRLDLASTYYRRIIEALTKIDRILKPMWPQKFQQAIFDIKGLSPPLQLTSGNDLGGVERSLQAYCVAFQVQLPAWRVEWNTPSQPTFRLLPPDGSGYTPLQLLAVFRALRYNSFFKSISLRDVDLSSLIGRNDYSQYRDSVVHTSLNGLRLSEDYYDLLLQAPILEQEVHALMFASDSIRSIDLTNVFGVQNITKRHSRTHSDYADIRKKTSEVLRPMLTLYKRQASHCHSVSLSNNPLAHSDVDELANLLVLDNIHFRRLELSSCGIGDAGLSKLWVGLVAQAGSLQWIDTSENQGMVSFEIIQDTLSRLPNITVLKIAGNTRLYPDVPLFDEDTIMAWALEELDLSGIMLNDDTVDVISSYLESTRSQSLGVLRLNNCGLTAQHIAILFRAMGQGRRLTVHINGNRLDEGVDDLCAAVACGFAPYGVFIQMVEFNYESSYVKLLRALTVNSTIECLSLAGSATPDAASSTACQALLEFFSENDTVRFLDMSGFDSKLDEGRLGREFSRSLGGLRKNTRIEHLRVRSQMLNFNVGDLAEAISENKSLHTIDCEGNDFNLSNFRHLIKHLEKNTTIRYFAAFSEQELAKAVKRSLTTAASPLPARRASVISRLRHDRGQNSAPKSLTQDLKDEWDTAATALQQILDRNQCLWQDMEASDSEGLCSTQGRNSKRNSIFPLAFGGLALEEHESCRAREIQNQNTHARTASTEDPRLSLYSKAVRPISTVSSEAALSPTTDGASSGSAGAPTPPEEDLQDNGGRQLHLRDPQQTESVYDDAGDSNYTYLDANDAENDLQMKTYRRFWNDPTSRIEEEEADGYEGENSSH